jgi:hypothetical protein
VNRENDGPRQPETIVGRAERLLSEEAARLAGVPGGRWVAALQRLQPRHSACSVSPSAYVCPACKAWAHAVKSVFD